MNINELKQQRAALIAESRSLLDKGGDSLTPSDQRKFDSILAEVADLDKKIVVSKAAQVEERRQVALEMGGEGLSMEPVKPGTQHSETRTFERGSEYEIFEPGQEVRSWTDSLDGKPGPDISIGEAIVGHIRGEKRAAEAGLDTKGGFIINPRVSGQFIDLVRNQSVISRAGARTIMFNGGGDTLSFVEQLSDVTAYWRPEAVEITESNPTFGRIDAHPRVVAAITQVSKELIWKSKNASEIITESLTSALALEIDRAGLRGIGVASEPQGVIGWTGVTTTDNSGSALAIDDLATWSSPIEVSNGPSPDRLTMVTTPQMALALRKLKDTTNQPIRFPEDIQRMRKLYSNQLRSTLGGGSGSEFIFGDFSQMAIISQVGVQVDTGHVGNDMKSLQFHIRAAAMLDSVVFRPAFFHHVSDVI